MVTQHIKLVGGGEKAVLATESRAVVSPAPSKSQLPNVLRLPEQLPILLAGPIIRRAEPAKVTIWLATSIALTMDGKITVAKTGDLVAKTRATRIKLGEKLFINLATFEKPGDGFPTRTLLAYNFDIELAGDTPGVLGFESGCVPLNRDETKLAGDIPSVLDVESGYVLLNPDDIAYADFGLPTFFLPESKSHSIRLMHASCRKLHGKGRDAAAQLNIALAATPEDFDKRPSALFLTGDQIYADDVDEDVIEGVSMLGRTLLGWEETVPARPIECAPVTFGRKSRAFVRDDHGFTVNEKDCANHLLGFGEFAAMYLLAWSPEIWSWPRFRQDPSFAKKGHKFASEDMRRVMANVPCYMMFDDHEITDDWNLTSEWIGKIKDHALARRIVANGLAAFWAFQSIGNDPVGRQKKLGDTIAEYVRGKGGSPKTFVSELLTFHDWNFTAPTAIPVIVLDTRTCRSFDKPGAANVGPGLLNRGALDRLAASLKEVGGAADDPVLIVSPAPFIGYGIPEWDLARRAQINKADKPIDPSYDPEAWFYNPATVRDFLQELAKSGKTRFVILSGDVHYGFTAMANCAVRVENEVRTISIVQATASALRNEGEGKIGIGLKGLRTIGGFPLLHYLADVLPDYYDSISLIDRFIIGRDRDNPYTFKSTLYVKAKFRKQLLEDWNVLIRWRYPLMGSSRIVTKNNAGMVDTDRHKTVHTLHTADGDHLAKILWDDIGLRLPLPIEHEKAPRALRVST